MMRLGWAMGLPEAWRLLRISLRPWRMAGVAFVSISVCVLIIAFVTVISIEFDRAGKSFIFFSTEYFTYLSAFLFGYQFILWAIGGPALVCAALAQEFTVGTWVFQETAPQPAWKLLLGKIAGAPGDLYVAALAGLPFIVVCLPLSSLLWFDVLQAYIFIIVVSLFFSALLLFLICVMGEQKNSSVVAALLIPLLLVYSFGVSFGFNEYNQGSFAALHPGMTLLSYSKLDLPGGVFMPSNLIFYGVEFPLFPFAIVFYAGWAAWFFWAAVGHVRFRMSLPMKRFHLFVLFAAVEFVFLGFVYNYTPEAFTLTTGMIVDMMALSAANVFLLYAVIFLHSRSMTEIRPWLYAFGTRRMRAADFFRDDAPVIFTIIPLFIIYIAGAIFLARMYGAVPNIKFVLMVQTAAVAVIVLRDALFFQGASLLSKKGRRIGLVVYGLVFCAVPGLVYLAHRDVPLLDLSPLTAIFAAGAANSIEKTSTLITGYLIINGLLAVVFAAVNVYLLVRARAGLAPRGQGS